PGVSPAGRQPGGAGDPSRHDGDGARRGDPPPAASGTGAYLRAVLARAPSRPGNRVTDPEGHRGAAPAGDRGNPAAAAGKCAILAAGAGHAMKALRGWSVATVAALALG